MLKIPSLTYKQLRVESLKQVVKYPHKFAATTDIPNFVTKYRDISAEDRLSEERVRVCGMVTNVREAGSKLRFIDLEGQGDKVQLKVDARVCQDGEMSAQLRRGDRVGDP